MIDLYTFTTPNGRKVSIMLEELGLPYTAHPINIMENEQFAPEFLKISPNNKIPAIVDQETGISVFESGAILIYLAEKTGSALLPREPAERAKTLEWLMFQMGGIGPMFGQLGHFHAFAAEKIPYAMKRYHDEGTRLLNVMDKRLAETDYLAGDYSIADIATYPWVKSLEFYIEQSGGKLDIPLGENVSRWKAKIAARPAVEKGMAIPQL